MLSDDFKVTYGRILASEPDFYKAALTLTNGDVGVSLWVSNNWRNDPVVQAAKKAEIDELSKVKLISENELVRKLLDVMDSPYSDSKSRVMAAAQIAKIYGYETKQSTAPVVNNNIMTQKVIAMPQFESDEEWARKAKEQQDQLLNVATSRH